MVLADAHRFVVEAPVALNHNHLQTGFGGSINAVATLAAYGSLWVRLRELASEIVIQESSIRFRRPVTRTIRAICELTAGTRLQAFVHELETRGRARIELFVVVEENGVTAAEFRGIFVAAAKTKLQPQSGAGSNG